MTYHLPSGEARIATTSALWWSASRLTSSNVKDISNFPLVQPLAYLRHCNKQHQLEFCSLFLQPLAIRTRRQSYCIYLSFLCVPQMAVNEIRCVVFSYTCTATR